MGDALPTCPLCGAAWRPGVDRWVALRALAGCKPARGWVHLAPCRGKRYRRTCTYADGMPIVPEDARPVALGRADGHRAA